MTQGQRLLLKDEQYITKTLPKGLWSIFVKVIIEVIMMTMTKAETKTLLALLEEVPDHRKGNAVRYSLRDVLFLGIFAILCGADTYTGMSTFCELHLQDLRKYLELPQGVPSHDAFGDIFSRVDKGAVSKCFQLFVDTIKLDESKDYVVSLDGKTVKKSENSKHKASHIETAYLSDLEIVLGQVDIEEKSNELTAIPKLLEMLVLTNCTVTIDAMGTHREFSRQILAKGADYIHPVKENQSRLLEDIKMYAEEDILPTDKGILIMEGRYAKTIDKGHGRIDQRECYLFDEADWLEEEHKWPGLQGVALIVNTRTIQKTGEVSVEPSYFIYSHDEMTAERFLSLQRKHWKIENNLHWCLDCCFNEDNMHVRMGHAAIIINMFRKLCMQMLKADSSVKDSLAGKRQRCAWSFDYAMTVVKQWAFNS
jgi:predicted transposase YbfD/YdcC